ncbi:MAG: hypothetical protein ABIM64_01665 [candidate division WOR-3 bacterium]
MKNSEIISHLSFLSYSSSKIRSVIIEQDEGKKKIRGNIHFFLRANTGSFKSSILRELAQNFHVDVIEMITQAGLVGTIDKNMNVIPGEAWNSRNKILLLDEFNLEGNSSCISPLLSLLEDQTYKKVVGRFALEKKERDGDLFFEVKAGELKMKTRFSCIICSMRKIEKNRSMNIEALLSRCVVYSYDLSYEEMNEILLGKKILKIEKTHLNSLTDVVISNSDYHHILEIVRSYPGFDYKRQYARTVCDCCRAFAVLRKHDEKTYNLLTMLRQTLY